MTLQIDGNCNQSILYFQMKERELLLSGYIRVCTIPRGFDKYEHIYKRRRK